MNKAEKISHGNIKSWEERRKKFFAKNPRCKICGEKLTHYTTTGMCPKCRAKKSRERFESNNPDYQKRYQHERWKNRKK